MFCVAIGIVGAVWLIYSCVTKGTYLVATLVDMPDFFCVCTLGSGVCWCCCIMGYRCVTGVLTWSVFSVTYCFPWRRLLCLFVYCCSVDFGMKLNKYAILINTACVGMSDVLKLTLYRNWYYNQRKPIGSLFILRIFHVPYLEWPRYFYIG